MVSINSLLMWYPVMTSKIKSPSSKSHIFDYVKSRNDKSMLIVSLDKSRGYLGFSMVTPPQRFPFGRDNLKNILVRTFKFGMWVYMGQRYWFVTLTFNLKVTGGLLKILGIFSLFGPVLLYRKSDHPMAGIYNTYICPL